MIGELVRKRKNSFTLCTDSVSFSFSAATVGSKKSRNQVI